MQGILTIAYLTFQEARRRKILLAAMIFGLAFQTLFAVGFYFIVRDMNLRSLNLQQKSISMNLIVMAALYVTNFLIIMTSILTPIDTLSGEIESGAIQSLATKPIPRSSIVLGKWLGFCSLVEIYVALMVSGVIFTVWMMSSVLPPNFLLGISLMMLEAALLVTLAIAGGTRLTTLANGVMCLGLYGISFIGGWVEQISTLTGNNTSRNLGIVASLLMPSESLWQLVAYNMQPPLVRDLQMTPFFVASVPSTSMVLWTAGYILLALAFAVYQFHRRIL